MGSLAVSDALMDVLSDALTDVLSYVQLDVLSESALLHCCCR